VKYAGNGLLENWTKHTRVYGNVCNVTSAVLADSKKTKGTGEKCIALSTLANWIFRSKIPRFAGVMNSVIKDMEIRRNPIDVMELDMTD
jgi:hypothetical protein